ncbi:hypothetical protein F5Y01DRAFT_9528 [Xylaria sp. FL0043]|nr:hypothetical protein F5Y01DRAFT_9528 [Xylaria sp. FL0043]
MPSPTISRTSAEPTLYEILSLTPKRLQGQDSAAQQKAIKQAYHKALLKHHPDKNPQDSPRTSSSSPISSPQSSKEAAPSKTQSSKSSSNGKSSSSSKSLSSVPKSQLTYTIDQITHAYSVLSDARQRKEYDRQLLLTSQSHSHSHSSSTSFSSTAEQKHSVSTRFHTGVETVDLDDLGFDERSGVYFGSCRCGNARGFQFTEAQLEEYEEDLVLMVQCLDCSLWMRVLFDAAEDEEQQQPQHQQQQSRQQPQQRQQQQHQNNSSPSNQTTMTSSNNQTRDAAERRGSHSVSRSGKGWRFNLSFDWGISLSGSASAGSSSSSGR